MRALLVVLLVVGFLARYAVWIAAVLGAVVVFVAVLWLAFRLARRVDAKHAEHAVLVDRADQQHAWILAGGDRGGYGQYPPHENCALGGRARRTRDGRARGIRHDGYDTRKQHGRGQSSSKDPGNAV